MRGAPPVRVVCGPDRRWRTFERAVACAAAATASAWGAQRLGLPVPVMAGLAAGMTLIAMRRLEAEPEHPPTLAWRGDAWTLDDDAGQPQVMLDLGNWLLLRFRFDSGKAPAWLPLDLSALSGTRHLLRTALHAAAAPRDARTSVAGHG